MLNIKTFCFNILQENTYVVSDDTRECVIIDCGAYYDAERNALVDYINSNNLKPVHLLATHGHFDHNFGINIVYDTWGLKPEIAAEDEWLISDLPGQFYAMAGIKLRCQYPKPDHFFAPTRSSALAPTSCRYFALQAIRLVALPFIARKRKWPLLATRCSA